MMQHLGIAGLFLLMVLAPCLIAMRAWREREDMHLEESAEPVTAQKVTAQTLAAKTLAAQTAAPSVAPVIEAAAASLPVLQSASPLTDPTPKAVAPAPAAKSLLRKVTEALLPASAEATPAVQYVDPRVPRTAVSLQPDPFDRAAALEGRASSAEAEAMLAQHAAIRANSTALAAAVRATAARAEAAAETADMAARYAQAALHEALAAQDAYLRDALYPQEAPMMGSVQTGSPAELDAQRRESDWAA